MNILPITRANKAFIIFFHRTLLTHRLLVVLLGVCILTFCTPKARRYKQTFFRMDTVTEITLVLFGNSDSYLFWEKADSLLLDWEDRFSVTGVKSEVQKLNNRISDTMPVSPQMSQLIAMALNYGDTLNAGFDLTILPIKELWGFGEQSGDLMPLPTQHQVDSALHYVSYKNIRLNTSGDSVIFLAPYTRIDVGGIAKGFVLREMAELFDRLGALSYLITAGGDIVCKGKRPDGKPWLIGIQHPRDNDAFIGTLPIESSASVVTSGDYERFRFVDGKRYHHIFNSHTGHTCTCNQSVTVYGPDPVIVDILSTGLFCRPASEIIDFINKRNAYRCLVVDSTGTISASTSWNGEISNGVKTHQTAR